MNGDGNGKSSLWIQTFSTDVNQGTTSSSNGYDASTGGISIGIDRKISNELIVGISSSYAGTNVNTRNTEERTENDTYQVGLYSGYNTKSYFLIYFIGNSYK